jgi:hypothetical protein
MGESLRAEIRRLALAQQQLNGLVAAMATQLDGAQARLLALESAPTAEASAAATMQHAVRALRSQAKKHHQVRKTGAMKRRCVLADMLCGDTALIKLCDTAGATCPPEQN